MGMCFLRAVTFALRNNFSRSSTYRKMYTAAVVDYHPLAPKHYSSPEEYLLANAAEYASIIKNARKSEVDIIVFPECGLTNIPPYLPADWPSDQLGVEVPTPVEPFESREHDFKSNQKLLKVLASAAKENNMYVVVNLVEKVTCSHEPDCPQEKSIMYDANIVFNRNGCIISRYRKFNLYGKLLSHEKEANVCTFETDFNVTFGMFICFDIIFGNPALRLITEKGVSNIIFTTAWFSELPFFAGTSVQLGWAYSMDVNLLASGYRNPETGSGGSGIYNGSGGALTVTLPLSKETELLISKVPVKQKRPVQVEQNRSFSYSSVHDEIGKIESEDEMSKILRKKFYPKSKFFGDLKFKKDPSLSRMSSKLLESDNVDPEVSQYSILDDVRPGFNASIKVKWKVNAPYQDSSPRYRLFAYDGPRPFDDRAEPVSVCGIVVCGNETVDSCGLVPNLDSPVRTTIESVEISVITSTITLGYLPIIMDFGLKQLPVTSFTFSKKFVQLKDSKTECIIKMSLIEPVDDLFVFSVYKIPG